MARQAGVLGGHFSVRQGGWLCTCGNHGCAEAEASTFVLPGVAAEHPEFARSVLRQAPLIDYVTVLRLARAGDGCTIALRAQAIEVWTTVIVNLIHAYDPERVIIGGGIMAGDAEFFPELERGVSADAHTPWGKVQLMRGQLGDAAALYGGDWLARTLLMGAS